MTPVAPAPPGDTTIAESIPQLVWLSDPSGRLEYCNRRWYEYFGLREADLATFVRHERLHPDEGPAWIAEWEQSLATGRPFEHESRLRRSDGEYRWFLSRSIPLRDDTGAIQRWFGTSTDIHDQKLAHALLAAQAQSSERRLQSALDGARDCVWDYDCVTHEIYRSAGWSGMLGYGDAVFDSSPAHWKEIAHPEDQERAYGRFTQFLNGERDFHEAEYRLRDASSAWRWISSKGKITERAADGTPLKVAGTASDITQRKTVEEALRAAKDEAERATRAKSAFLAKMSHELRTPLNSIIGFANVVHKNRSGTLALSELAYIDRIRANGVHLLRLIDDVLDAGTIEAGRMEVELSTLRLDVMIRELVAQAESQVQPGVRIVAELPPGSILLRADELRLRQIIINQLSNAIKFTESGSISAKVICDAANEPQLIEIRDTGIGISPERAAAIFSSFEQADTGTTRLYGGTGLGLAISRSLCEQMGFTLTMTSEVGVGSTFTIDLAPGKPRRASTETR